MARRIRAVKMENKTKIVAVFGIEELKNVDPRETDYEYEITTKYHTSQSAIQFYFHLKFNDAVKFNLILSFKDQKSAIDYLLEGCPLFLIYNQASKDYIADVRNFSKYSDVFNGTTILSLPKQVIIDIKDYKEVYLSN
jgi:hypothetical protein